MILSKLIQELAKQHIKLSLKDGALSINGPKGAVTPLILNALKEHKAELIASLQGAEKRHHTISIAQRGEPLPLSFAQQRLWLLDKIADGSAHYNICGAVKLSGVIDIDALNKSFSSLLARHEILRTCYREDDDGNPIQVIQRPSEIQVETVDLSKVNCDLTQKCIEEEADKEALSLFDLSSDLMMRTRLLKLSEYEHILLVTMHHIASDGWSMSILIEEFSKLYVAFCRGEREALQELPIQYADYSSWQRHWFSNEKLKEQLKYWREQLTGIPLVHSLPLDYARPSRPRHIGDNIMSTIDKNTAGKLQEICQSQGATLFMGLHTVFSVLLARCSSENDIVVGTPIANREQEGIKGLIGCFANTLVLRCKLSGDDSLVSLIKQNKSTLLDAYQHQQVPFDKVVEELQPERSLSHSPLFQVMLVLQNNEDGELELPGLSLSPIKQSGAVAKYDLTLEVSESDEGLHLVWEYDTDLFVQETIKRLASHFELLLEGLTGNPEKPVFSIEMLSEAEKHQQLVAWNDTAVEYPKEQCIHTLFEAQVEATPDAVAVVFEEQTMTYRELNAKANQLAQYLVEEKGVIPDTLVGICVERSLEMMVGILGVLKAGGAYVPLDPNYPAARLAYMLEDASLTTVLTQESLRGVTPVKASQAVYLDSSVLCDELGNYSSDNIGIDSVRSSHLAYVIYTSGSTGNPKGVMIEHRSAHGLIAWAKKHYGEAQLKAVLASTSMCFDLSIFEFFAPLSTGGKVVLVKNAFDLPAAYVEDLTLINTVPSVIESLLLELDFSMDGKVLNLAGEPLKQSLVERLYNKGFSLVYDLYGPSECTTYSTCIERKVNGIASIGSPISNLQCYILHENSLLPTGGVGELYIGGVGLARGYLNRPELTDEKFVTNPFYDEANPASSERLYKTGDLVRYLPDGNLEFLGRIDHQVKIRGFRIELGEIEQQLLSDGRVNDAVVVADVKEADKRLVAYVTHDDAEAMLMDEESAQRQRNDLIASLKAQLAQTLPDYMIPSVFVVLTHMPLTPNGKVDRKGLPAPDISQQQQVYVAPTTDTEKMLCEIWQDILGVEQVGITDNFFALGGHSLLVMNVIASVQKAGYSLRAQEFFSALQLAALAKKIDSNKGRIQPMCAAPENLIPAQCNHITPEMLPLVTLTVEDIQSITEQVSGNISNIQDIYPLGALQESILFTHMMSKKNDPYVTQLLYKANNKEALDEFIDSLNFIINRHDVLRTAIVWKGISQPVQVVFKEVTLPIDRFNLSEELDSEANVIELASSESHWLDITHAPLIKLRVARGKQGEYFLFLQVHHMVIDHVSLEIIQREIDVYRSGQAASLPVSQPYRNFISHTIQQEKKHDAKSYFTNLLEGVDEATAPFALIDNQRDGVHVSELRKLVPRNVSIRLRELSKSLKIAPSSLFHSAYGLVIAACSGKNDIVFGSVMSGRLQGAVGTESILGVCINTLPLRLNLNEVSVRDYVLNTHQHLVELLPFEQTPLAFIQSCSDVANNTPLFGAILNYRHSKDDQSNAHSEAKSDDAIVQLRVKERTNYPFTLNVDDLGLDFELDFQIDTDVDIERVMYYMQRAIEQLVEHLSIYPEKLVQSVRVISDNEARQLLVEWNGVEEEFPSDKCIHQLFEEQAAITPDAIAVTFESEHIRYSELNSRANQLAHYLIEQHKVKPDSLIGVCFERSVDMLVSILAVLKAGGAYVPLDPNYPQSRLTYMMLDASLNTVLTESDLQESLQGASIQAVCVDAEHIQLQVKKYSVENIEPCNIGLTASHLAYVIYTSGSTGNPKGVMVEHRNIKRLMASTEADFQFDSQDVWTMFHSYAFDFSVWEIWGALSYGGRLVIVPYWVSRSSSDFYQLLADEQVTVLNQTPSAFSQVIQEDKKATNTKLALRYVIFGGEALNLASLTPWIEKYGDNHPQLINMYGITETTVHVTRQRITQEVIASSQDASTIGRALKDLNLVVLNEHNMLVPTGVAGEMYISGAGVTRGYLNQAALTAARFVQLPELGEQRFYKTGDLARYTENGDLEYLGRLDHQVKLRGFRIELGEIESALTRRELVNDAVVQVKESIDGNKRLVGYLAVGKLPQEDTNAMINSLKGYLSEQLPSHMVPAAFVCLEELPLTGNGKVDRKALPEPDISQQQGKYIAPSTATEKVLCEIWQEVLGIEQVGITDDFFDIGGHSLLATQAITKINTTCEVTLSITSIFLEPTVEAIAAQIEILKINNSNLHELKSEETIEEGIL
ncbi:non-ribosomal peptide synthetase [Pseudoalteromonas luteoviolacea]|uniref:non-ribosomal peptide synthetase n=1 Tax=Pseudoalteromonas luteoviolacea TaxID=43657 RepID=UPI001154B375|nr:non-ribosomal peptide synthetase [Pseudoalteromonas luteoviolacea]TQF71314.1 amino acid adenylation domain-containing protein [Pseudoalteromonas luteoviolacea]